jgi:hypothetical protein
MMSLSRTFSRATPAIALLGPLAIFGLLYALAVQPQRAAAEAAVEEAAALRGQLDRGRALIARSLQSTLPPLAEQEFARPAEDLAPGVADAVRGLAASPAVGGLADLSVELGAPGGSPLDPRIELFGASIAYTPVSVTFTAPYDRVGRFLWNLHSLPSMFELRSLDLEPAGDPTRMRARLVIFVLRRPGLARPAGAEEPALQAVDMSDPPQWPRDPFASRAVAPVAPQVAASSATVVQSILVSSQRQLALVDDQIVKAGDKLGSSMVRSVDADGITLITEAGLVKRVPLKRPAMRLRQ